MNELGRSAGGSAANASALVILAVAEELHSHMTYSLGPHIEEWKKLSHEKVRLRVGKDSPHLLIGGSHAGTARVWSLHNPTQAQ